MDQDRSLAFAFGYNMHYRKLNVLLWHIKPLDPRINSFKKIRMPWWKTLCGFRLNYPLEK